MSRSAKGIAEKPGVNVKAKSGLNKSILDQGWYEFRQQLRTLIARAAIELKNQPRKISFKAVQETMQGFRILLLQAEMLQAETTMLPKMVEYKVLVASEHICRQLTWSQRTQSSKKRTKAI